MMSYLKVKIFLIGAYSDFLHNQPLPNDKILDQSKFKACTENKISMSL